MKLLLLLLCKEKKNPELNEVLIEGLPMQKRHRSPSTGCDLTPRVTRVVGG